MNNWKVIFATVVIFGAGVITGGLLVNYVQKCYHKPAHDKLAQAASGHAAFTNQPGRPAENGRVHLPESLSKQFLQKLDEALRLDPKQRERIREIISNGQNHIRRVVQDARLEIRDVLTLEQRQQFDELVKRPLRKPAAGTNAAVKLPPKFAAPAPPLAQ